jgi:hypothetical protein
VVWPTAAHADGTVIFPTVVRVSGCSKVLASSGEDCDTDTQTCTELSGGYSIYVDSVKADAANTPIWGSITPFDRSVTGEWMCVSVSITAVVGIKSSSIYAMVRNVAATVAFDDFEAVVVEIKAPCPIHSEGENVVDGCTCDVGFDGNVTFSAAPPFYQSTCTKQVDSCDNPSCNAKRRRWRRMVVPKP